MESLKNGERGVRELFLALNEFSSSNVQERVLKGYRRGIYTPQLENNCWAKGYPETPGKPSFRPGSSNPDTPDNGVRSIRPHTWSIRVRQGKTLVLALLNCFVAHNYLSRFS